MWNNCHANWYGGAVGFYAKTQNNLML